jgi:hypothetical protein
VRPLFTIISAVSLLMCVALTALLVRSWFFYDNFKRNSYSESNHTFTISGVTIWCGRIAYVEVKVADPKGYVLSAEDRASITRECIGWTRENLKTPPRLDLRNSLFESFWKRDGYGLYDHRSYVVFFPFWPAIVLFSLAPAITFVRRRRTVARRSSNHCFRCGYDLRATPDRCPECGAEPTSSRVAAQP